MTMSKQHGGGFSNGLFVGIILGAVLVLLFTTRKGRKILRMLSDEGFDKVKDWEKIMGEIDFDPSTLRQAQGSGQGDSEEMNNDYLVRPSPMPHHSPNGHVAHTHHRVKPTSRLHFRGVSKH